MSREAQIGQFIQDQLTKRGLDEVTAVEAARWLDDAGLLLDSPDRPGKALRSLLRDGAISGGDQRPPRPNGRWFMVRSSDPGDGLREGAAGPTRASGHAPLEPNGGIEAARERFRPREVRVLFVGESPPAGGTFFYVRNSILFAATRDAFARAFPDSQDDADFLASFQRMGCFLEDLCREPANRLRPKEREELRQQNIPELAERLTGLHPDLVIVVMKAILPHAKEALSLAGLSEATVCAVPFPRPEWRARYVAETAAHLAKALGE